VSEHRREPPSLAGLQIAVVVLRYFVAVPAGLADPSG